MNSYNHFVKRPADFLTSLVLLVILSPVILVVVVLLFLTNKGSILYLQTRSGYKGKPFTIIKFKTMSDEVDSKGNLLSDDVRLTKLGKWIRSVSLDELLQLINVLKGDMSLVGPRPLLMEYILLYSEEQAKRHDVMPGITGWAQVNGRNSISWEQKFNFDLEYVQQQSFGLDLKILGFTVLDVLTRKGISAHGSATMEKFKGSKL